MRGPGDEFGLQPVDLAQVGDVLEQQHGPDQAGSRASRMEWCAGGRRAPRHRQRAARRPRPPRLRPFVAIRGRPSTAIERRGSLVTSSIGLPRTVASGPNSGSAARLMRCTRPCAVGHDHGIVEGVHRRLSGLLRDEDLAQVGLAQLPNPLRHLVELGPPARRARRSSGLPRPCRGRRRRLRLVAAVSCRTGSDDAVREENREPDTADDECAARSRASLRNQRRASRRMPRRPFAASHPDSGVSSRSHCARSSVNSGSSCRNTRPPRPGDSVRPVRATCPDVEQEAIERRYSSRLGLGRSPGRSRLRQAP